MKTVFPQRARLLFLATATATAVALLLAALAAPAGAQDRSADLDAAERALEELRYEQALPLLDRAWQSGQNGPKALARLFRLQGEVAATLGDEAGARRAFARWLSLVPDARLPEGTSPKIVASFDAARAQLGAARLHVDVQVTADGAAVAMIVATDPLALVAGARASYRGEGGVQGTVSGKGGARVNLPLPTAGLYEVVVAAVDSYGNHLVEQSITVGEGDPPPSDDDPVAAPRAPPRPDDSGVEAARPRPPREARTPSRPFYANAWFWGALGAGAGVAGAYFGVQARQAQHELYALNASSEQHPFAEARAIEDRLRSDALAADVSFAVAGACVVVAVVLWLRPAPRRPGVSARVGAGPGSAQVTLGWQW